MHFFSEQISLCDKEEENVKCSPTKISLQEQHYDYKITGSIFITLY